MKGCGQAGKAVGKISRLDNVDRGKTGMKITQMALAAVVMVTLAGCSSPVERFADCMATYNDSSTCLALEEANRQRWQALQQAGESMQEAGKAMEPQRPIVTNCTETLPGTVQCTTY